MKPLLLLSFSLLLHALLYSQDWQWVQSAGGDNYHNVGQSVCTDPHGNAIITGYHRPSFRLHRNTLGDATVELANYERKDNRMFLAKYGPDGQLHWANYAKGYFAEGTSVASDEQGCIYVTGRFAEPTLFSSQDGTQQEINGYFPGMMFLAKYSPTGRLLWVIKGGSKQGFSGGEVLKVVNGQVYVGGYAEIISGEALEFQGTDGRVSYHTPVKNLPFGQAKVGFLAAYDRKGRLQGVEFFGGSQAEVRITDLAFGHGGKIYLSGLLSGRMSLKGRILETDNFSTEGFCLALDEKGSVRWAARVKGDIDLESGLHLAFAGDALAFAYAGKSATSFTIEQHGLETESPEGGHAALVLLDQSGALRWHQYGAMTRGKVSVKSLVADPLGGLLIAGYYLGDLAVGSQTLHTSGFYREHDPDLGEYSWWDKNAFVARFHPEGDADWIRSSSGKQEEAAHAVAVGPGNHIFLTGYFVSGGPARLGDLEMRDLGKVNVFLASLTGEARDTSPEPVALLTRSEMPERKTVEKEEISVFSEKLVLSLWDNHMIDGDVISLYANEKCILKNYRLEGISKTLTLELPKGEYRLRLHAENTGDIYPNTAAITIDDGQFRQTVLLASDLNRSEAVKITVK